MMITDFATHNEEVRRLWEAFDAGRPYRVPVVFNFSRRFWLLTPELNTEGYSFRDYFEDPDIMMKVQLESAKWIRLNVPQDQEMGLPEESWGGIHVDFQNSYEAAWFGCKIVYPEGEVPDTVPLLRDDKKGLFKLEIPDPLKGNLMGRVYEYYHYFEEKRKDFEFEGKPVGRTGVPTGTDGPFTAACNLRGATEVCIDIYEDPEYVHALMEFVTEGIIARIKAWMDFMGIEYPTQSWGFADDSIQLLSEDTYKEFVLPYHRRLIETFSLGGPNSIHLCGRASHHFKTLMKELNIKSFDTGFPTDLGAMRKELGPDVLLRGNIHPELLRLGPPETIREAVRKLLDSGVMEGGKFILCEGNNVAPRTPVANFAAMYEAGKEYGRYPEGASV
ncbi:MAG TPA: hypothetical protein GX509_01820 [Firmicutes bacterium]|nr:hypothetical protein [Bacillota bacterium]